METNEPPFLSNFGFMLTYKCTVACPHCIVKAGPHRKEEMKLLHAINWLDQIADFREAKDFQIGISFTGGEPFYNQDMLRNIVDHAFQNKFMVSVVTNAFWADTKESAIKVLSAFDSIQLVSISTDKYHQENIPFSYIKNAMIACKKLGKYYNIAVSTESDSDEDHIKLCDDLLEVTEKDNIQTAYTVPVGRAANLVNKNNFSLDPEPTKSACYMANFPVIFPNGDVIACIGPPIVIKKHNPLILGNLHEESLQIILERAENNPVLHAIRIFGPRILVDLLKENGHADLLPASFIKECPCDVCFKLFSDNNIGQVLEDLTQTPEFIEKVAYGRYYYLNETEMLVAQEKFVS